MYGLPPKTDFSCSKTHLREHASAIRFWNLVLCCEAIQNTRAAGVTLS